MLLACGFQNRLVTAFLIKRVNIGSLLMRFFLLDDKYRKQPTRYTAEIDNFIGVPHNDILIPHKDTVDIEKTYYDS